MNLELTDRQASNLVFTLDIVLDSWAFDGDQFYYDLAADLAYIKNVIKYGAAE